MLQMENIHKHEIELKKYLVKRLKELGYKSKINCDDKGGNYV